MSNQIFTASLEHVEDSSNTTAAGTNPGKTSRRRYKATTNEKRALLISTMMGSSRSIREVSPSLSINGRFPRNSASPTPQPRPSFAYTRTRDGSTRRNGHDRPQADSVSQRSSLSRPSVPMSRRRDKLSPSMRRRRRSSSLWPCSWCRRWHICQEVSGLGDSLSTLRPAWPDCRSITAKRGASLYLYLR